MPDGQIWGDGLIESDFQHVMVYYANVLPNGAPDFTNKHVIHFWFSEFGHLSKNELRHYMDNMVRTSKFFPTIAEILAATGQARHVTDDSRARAAAARIIATVKKCGSIRDFERIQNELGDLAWAVVVQNGGWIAVCESLTNDNLGMREAQFRGLAMAVIEQHRTGGNVSMGLPELPGMPSAVPAITEK